MMHVIQTQMGFLEWSHIAWYRLQSCIKAHRSLMQILYVLWGMTQLQHHTQLRREKQAIDINKA